MILLYTYWRDPLEIKAIVDSSKQSIQKSSYTIFEFKTKELINVDTGATVLEAPEEDYH